VNMSRKENRRKRDGKRRPDNGQWNAKNQKERPFGDSKKKRPNRGEEEHLKRRKAAGDRELGGGDKGHAPRIGGRGAKVSWPTKIKMRAQQNSASLYAQDKRGPIKFNEDEQIGEGIPAWKPPAGRSSL